MEGFQPRIEAPPPRQLTPNDQLREFVSNAAGEWCLVHECREPDRHKRNKVYWRLRNVFRDARFEIETAYAGGVYRVYARLKTGKAAA